MFNKAKHLKNQKGLTLVELLAVIVILAIIAAIAIPSIGNIIDNSRAKAQISDAVSVLNAANIYFTDKPNAGAVNGANVTGQTVEDLISTGYLENLGKLKDVTVTKGFPNTITFTVTEGVKIAGSTDEKVVDATLEKLSKATVSKGVITIP